MIRSDGIGHDEFSSGSVKVFDRLLACVPTGPRSGGSGTFMVETPMVKTQGDVTMKATLASALLRFHTNHLMLLFMN